MSKLADVVSKAAPVLGAALGGVGAPIGLIVSGIAKLFGADGEDDLLAKIKADPEAYVKLRQFELEHQYDLERIVAADKASAREREVEIVKATGRRDYVLDFIAVFIVLGFFAIVLIVAFTKMDQTDHDILYLLTGQLSGSFLLVISYFFGSSVPVKSQQAVLPPPAQTR